MTLKKFNEEAYIYGHNSGAEMTMGRISHGLT